MILCQFLLFPVLVRRVGMVRLQRFSSILSVILALLLPNVRYLSWSEGATHHVLGIILLLHQICLSNVSEHGVGRGRLVRAAMVV